MLGSRGGALWWTLVSVFCALLCSGETKPKMTASYICIVILIINLCELNTMLWAGSRQYGHICELSIPAKLAYLSELYGIGHQHRVIHIVSLPL